jgi:diguanylate cyclase (GGDEF)-like protein
MEFLSAIRLVQNIQLICFAVIFLCMFCENPRDYRVRWLLANYLLGGIGALAAWKNLHVPAPLGYVLSFEIPLLRYAALHLAVVSFVGIGRSTRWVPASLSLACLPVFLLGHSPALQMQQYNLLALILAIQTLWTAALLGLSREPLTRWPRFLMAGFLLVYAAMETARIAVTLATGTDPAHAAPWLESLSIDIFVVASSLTPLAFIWMMNSRLLADLRRQTVSDPLTRLLNRRGFQEAFDSLCAAHIASGREFALAVADLDRFKSINDTYGHVEGDTVLYRVATIFQRELRPGDVIGRLGGEEFVFLFAEAGPAQAVSITERLRAALEHATFPVPDGNLNVTASFGVTTALGHKATSLVALLREADTAMYEAKTAGRNLIRLCTPPPATLGTPLIDIACRPAFG